MIYYKTVNIADFNNLKEHGGFVPHFTKNIVGKVGRIYTIRNKINSEEIKAKCTQSTPLHFRSDF